MNTNLTSRMLNIALVFAISIALTFTGSQAALAAHPGSASSGSQASQGEGMFLSPADLDAITPNGSKVLDPTVFLQALRQLEASEAVRVIVREGRSTNYRYIVPEGSVTLPSAADMAKSLREAGRQSTGAKSDLLTPQLEIRLSGMRTAVGFNTTDQQALAAGGAAVLAAALCAIPAVGWVACTLIGVVVGVATTYVVANGICSNRRVLWWYDVKGGSVIQCRSTRPF